MYSLFEYLRHIRSHIAIFMLETLRW